MLRWLLDLLFGLLAEESAKPDTPLAVGWAKEISVTGYDAMEDELKQRAAVVETARGLINVAYKFGAEVNAKDTKLVAIDCSELVEYCYAHNGLQMPDGSYNQFNFCAPVAAPKPGDLGFLFTPELGRIGHVEMFVGAGSIVGAVGGKVATVRESSADRLAANPNFRGWRRPPYWARPQSDRIDNGGEHVG